MSASDCAVICEQLYDKAVSAIVGLPPTEQNGKIDGHLPQIRKDYERTFCAAAITSICVCLFRVLWLLTVVSRFHTLEALMLCYPISWILASFTFYITYRKGNWLKGQTLHA